MILSSAEMKELELNFTFIRPGESSFIELGNTSQQLKEISYELD